MTSDPRGELYLSTVRRMMESHGARLFGHAAAVGASLRHAPTAALLRSMGGHARELAAHFLELSDLHRELVGAPLDPPSLGREGPADPASWPEAVAAQLVGGRQCRWQLREHDDCSYAPYRAFVGRAAGALDARQSPVELAAAELAASPEHAPALADALDRWTAWAVDAFGRPNTPGMAYAIREGLRRRDAAATRQDFLDDLRAVARARSLPLHPRWMPAPERPSFMAALEAIARPGREPD